MKKFSIADGIASSFTGWLPATRVGGDPISVQSINALAKGAGAAFDIELWITTTEEAGAPVGLWKLTPNLTASATTEFPAEATEGYLFDAPFLWIHPRVISLTGSLAIWGIV